MEIGRLVQWILLYYSAKEYDADNIRFDENEKDTSKMQCNDLTVHWKWPDNCQPAKSI